MAYHPDVNLFQCRMLTCIPFFYSLTAPTEVVKQIIVNIDAGVEVEVTIAA